MMANTKKEFYGAYINDQEGYCFAKSKYEEMVKEYGVKNVFLETDKNKGIIKIGIISG